MSSSTAKLFMDGDDQAVLLPDEFRFEGTEVRISKVDDKVILEPIPPIHLAPDVLDYLTEQAAARGISLSALANALLKKAIELIEATK